MALGYESKCWSAKGNCRALAAARCRFSFLILPFLYFSFSREIWHFQKCSFCYSDAVLKAPKNNICYYLSFVYFQSIIPLSSSLPCAVPDPSLFNASPSLLFSLFFLPVPSLLPLAFLFLFSSHCCIFSSLTCISSFQICSQMVFLWFCHLIFNFTLNTFLSLINNSVHKNNLSSSLRCSNTLPNLYFGLPNNVHSFYLPDESN